MKSIWLLTNPDGSLRFFPPGAHPATYRMREQLRLAESLPPNGELQEFTEHLRGQIAMFEERESEIKAQYTTWLDRQHD